jgi:hypothetical protein
MNLNRVHPLLLEWAAHYSHLREVTAADVITATGPLTGSLRRQTLTALRSSARDHLVRSGDRQVVMPQAPRSLARPGHDDRHGGLHVGGDGPAPAGQAQVPERTYGTSWNRNGNPISDCATPSHPG